jgi:DNA replication protein DnaC
LSERKREAVAVGDLAEEWLAVQKRTLEILPEEPAVDAAEQARKEAEAKIAEQSEENRRRLMRAVDRLGVPLRHAQQIMFGKVEDSEALQVVAKWRSLNNRGALLVLCGNVGCGKTLAAAKAVLDGPPLDRLGKPWPDRYHARFLDVADLHELGLFDRSGMYEPLFKCSVLVIDDVGTEYDDKSGVMRVILDRIVNKRYAGGGWTVITTNLASGAFRERYGERIMNRLHDDGCGFQRVQGQYRERTTDGQ